MHFCDIKYAIIDFTQGAKVAGLLAGPHFVTNGEQTHSPFRRLRRTCPTDYYFYRRYPVGDWPVGTEF